MLYNTQTGKTEISVSEFVAIAAQGASSFTANDGSISASEPIFTFGKSRSIEYDFSFGNIDFSLKAKFEDVAGNTLSLTFLTEERACKLRKSTEKICRAEAFITAYMLIKLGLADASALRVNIRYRSERYGDVSEKSEEPTEDNLRAFFERCAEAILPFAEIEKERVAIRLPSMKTAKFPYGNVREGQNEFIRAVYRTIARGGELFANAPTGTGKTVSALFPAIRALGNGKISKVFYLTPKTTIAEPVRECLNDFERSGVKVRAVVLPSKERACMRGTVCRDGITHCENLDFARLRAAVFALCAEGLTTVTLADLKRVAKQYTVCPHELALGYSELCDIVVCDFNYLFDPDVYLRRYFDKRGEYAFLIDEAHNLGERGREMFSAELDTAELMLPSISPVINEHSEIKGASERLTADFRNLLLPLVKDELRENSAGEKQGAYKTGSIPQGMHTLFDNAIEICELEIKKNYSARDEERGARARLLKDYLHSLKKFRRCVEAFGSGFELFITYDEVKENAGGEVKTYENLRAKVFCLDTGAVLRERISLGRSSVFFSGTLNPLDYFRDTLGGDRSSEVLRVSSPFVSEQVAVGIVDSVSTRFNEREDTLIDVCRFISASMAPKKGHYMIFTPSYAYCKALYDTFVSKFPKIRAILQKPDMTSAEKQSFMASFGEENEGFLAAFCVTGGIFAEGIDLPGEKLIGAIIVGISMPTPSMEREAISAYYDDKMEAGKLYSYIYPGLNKVLQAAGRVIRSEDDRGIIVLIDDRFRDPLYRDAAPALWQNMDYYSKAVALNESIKEFWDT